MHITFEVTVSMKLSCNFVTETSYEFVGPTTEVDCMLVQLPLEICKNLVQFYYKLCKSVTLEDQRSKLFDLKMELVWPK